MQVLGYVRVSTDEQANNGSGLEAQRQAIAAECERRGWEVVDMIEDAGCSARNLKRPGIQVALDRLKRGEASGLVVAKLDRLSRSVVDFASLLERASRESWALVTLDAPVDTTTPAGEAMASVLAIFAQFERRLTGQRTKEALAVKRAEGVRLGRRRETPDAVVQRIVGERNGKASLQAIADGLNRDRVPTVRGGAKWWPATVKAVLGSVAYDGELAARE